MFNDFYVIFDDLNYVRSTATVIIIGKLRLRNFVTALFAENKYIYTLRAKKLVL